MTSSPLTFDGLTIRANSTHLADTAVILLHGYGANKENLAPIAQYISGYDWYLPDGPERLSFGQLEIGRAWFPLDLAAFEQAAMNKDYAALTRMPFRGLNEASAALSEQCSRLKSIYKRVILGGFSQGSVVALDSYLTQSNPVDGLLLFSTTLMHRGSWQEQIALKSPIPVFQSHGQHDEVLPFSIARETHSMLLSHNIPVHFEEFKGGHEIPVQVLNEARQWLAKS